MSLQAAGVHPSRTMAVTQPSRFSSRPVLPIANVDVVRFGNSEALGPPSRVVRVRTENGQTLNLRHWWLTGTQESNAHKPVVLLIHGLSGRSAWMAPLVEELMEAHGDKLQFVGLDIPVIGQHPFGEGHINKTLELADTIREAIGYVSGEIKASYPQKADCQFGTQESPSPVHAVGLSLGGMPLSYVAGTKPPKNLKTLSLISPAFDRHPDQAGFRGWMKMLRAWVNKLLGRSQTVRITKPNPPVDDPSGNYTPLQRKVRAEKRNAPDRVETLTLKSYWNLFKLKFLVNHRALKNIKIPTRIFMTRTDKMVDSHAIEAGYQKIPAPDKALIPFAKAEHDLINDPAVSTVAKSIGELIQGIPV